MFTGIVEEVGTVRKLAGSRLAVGASLTLEDLKMGDSIAINGACMTVVELDGAGFGVDVSPETLRRTSLGQLAPGSRVNLERSPARGRTAGRSCGAGATWTPPAASPPSNPKAIAS